MSSIEQLVARQIALCEIKRRYEEENIRPAPVKVDNVAYGPCLLISREHGSGGTALAHLIGERLGWRIFDREVVEEVARCAHVREQLIASVDDRVRSRWSETARWLAEGEGVGRQTYLLFLRQVLLTLGHHGDVVIIGRGAHHVLPRKCAVCLRVVAPIDLRIKRVADREEISLEKARREVERVDAERAAFIHEAFFRDVADATEYDLVVNTGELELEAAAAVVLEALHVKLGVQRETATCVR
jgi:hypothetical protein